jgi:predicted dehydrogenase
MAKRLVLPALHASEDFELRAVASRSRAKAQELADLYRCEAVEGYLPLLDHSDLDAVYIPLPTGMHHEWGVKALRRNKHVFMEKPLAHTLEGARELVALARERGLALMENFMFLHHSQHRFVREKIVNGDIGELRVFRSAFGFPLRSPNNIRYKKELGGGALLDVGVYTLRAAQLFLGNDLKVKAASLARGDEHMAVDRFGGAYLVNPKGQLGEVAFGFDNYYQCNYELWGSRGKLVAERAFTAGPGFGPRIVLESQNHRQEFVLLPDNHFANILKSFHSSIVESTFEEQYEALDRQAFLIDQVFQHAQG